MSEVSSHWLRVAFWFLAGIVVVRLAPETRPIIILILPMAAVLATRIGPPEPVRIRNRRDR